MRTITVPPQLDGSREAVNERRSYFAGTPQERALAEARRAGRMQGRTEAFEHLRATAALHQGQVGDARRRSALNAAADAIRDGREPTRG